MIWLLFDLEDSIHEFWVGLFVTAFFVGYLTKSFCHFFCFASGIHLLVCDLLVLRRAALGQKHQVHPRRGAEDGHQPAGHRALQEDL